MLSQDSNVFLCCVLVSAVGVALKEALSPEFKIYQQQVMDNAKALCAALQKKGFTIVSGRHTVSFDFISDVTVVLFIPLLLCRR